MKTTASRAQCCLCACLCTADRLHIHHFACLPSLSVSPPSVLVPFVRARRQEVNKELHAMETDQLVRKVQDVPPLWQRALHAREAQEPTQTGSTRPQSGEGVSQVPVPLTDHLQRELYDKLTESRTSVALKQLVKETGQDKAVVNKALSELQKQGLAKQDEPASPPQWSAVR
eukprot:TRINITY_DN14998_c0_g1_i2.p1 TRINITY_DN14998_c0_g1~~TRINITY_DN14998_c0_g1_i2.p1  ORF type:complete len:172 (-),score=23.85 TRINITY_DN14998_c0_g1_i2:307-822(-)